MEEIKMLPVRQNDVASILTKNGFKIKDFDFKPLTNESFIIQYKPVKVYYLSIQNKQFSLKPGQDGRMDLSGECVGWSNSLIRVAFWLKGLKENVDIKNPWEEIEDAQEEMNDINFDSYEEMFSDEDKIEIGEKLNLLLLEIGKLNIDTTEIKKDMDHLKTMSDKISKKDFVLLFLGTITGWIFNGVISPENTHTVWTAVKSLFSSFKLKLLS